MHGVCARGWWSSCSRQTPSATCSACVPHTHTFFYFIFFTQFRPGDLEGIPLFLQCCLVLFLLSSFFFFQSVQERERERESTLPGLVDGIGPAPGGRRPNAIGCRRRTTPSTRSTVPSTTLGDGQSKGSIYRISLQWPLRVCVCVSVCVSVCLSVCDGRHQNGGGGGDHCMQMRAP